MENLKTAETNTFKYEQIALGAIFLDSNADTGNLGAHHFSSQKHAVTFTATQHVRAKGEPVNIVTVVDQLTSIGKLEQAGGAAYIASLIDSNSENAVPTAANSRFYADKIVEKWAEAERKKYVQHLAAALKNGQDFDEALEFFNLQIGQLTEELGGGSKDRRFRFNPISDLEIKPPNWLISAHFEKEMLIMIFGDTGSYKTFVALDQGLHIAAGRPWHGHEVQQGPVAYICGEGLPNVKKRMAAWGAYHHTDVDSLPFYVSSGPAALVDEGSLSETLFAVENDLQEPPVLIIIDTLNRNIGAADENSSVDMTSFVKACDGLRVRTGATVAIIHHTGLANKERSRGHSALKAALDSEFRVDVDDTKTIRLESTKSKDHEPPEPMAFRPTQVTVELPEGSDPQEIESVVLTPTSYEPPAKKGKEGRGKNQTIALEVLDNEIARHRKNVEDSGRDPSAARVAVDAWKAACIDAGMSRNRFNEVMRSLSEKNIISIKHGFVDKSEASE